MRDVAVLGGGLAGAAACLGLARRGIRPLWLAHPPGAADKPGESLSPAARTVLDDLGAAGLLDDPAHRPANSVFSAWGSARLHERSSAVHLEGPAMVVDRAGFEAALFARADTLCDRIGARAGHCRLDGGRWRIAHGQGTAEAALVIDATGRRAVVARNHARRFRADRLVALVAFLRQRPGSDVAPTPATVIETVPEGWWYATLLADGRLALNFYTDADLVPPGARRSLPAFRALLDRTTHIARWIGEAEFLPDAPPRLASAATTWIAPCTGDRWLAAGDAAAAFDPLSSHGMTTALWTGARAAGAAAALLGGDAAPARDYADAVARGVQEFLEARARIYSEERRFAASPFWQRRSAAMARAGAAT